MALKEMVAIVDEQKILDRIYVIRGKKVMLDEDLAQMYNVETRRLNEQLKRNSRRFPKDFMFTLTSKEYEILKSQNATSRRWGGRRKLPNAFTEQGVAMLSSILNSEVAIEVRMKSLNKQGVSGSVEATSMTSLSLVAHLVRFPGAFV